ncbi:hypothetical protein B0T18DRAFT_435361 [Schizothecium vesticola]|uniref:Uncharacterized protein n=1 Tax=Schizothecium vesticola TaxID=314040 RepID=A0AA40F3X4_9PEZI|nr:hypothetical protein B0T18DRAFT_435361 [Schizothecium vesticola]
MSVTRRGGRAAALPVVIILACGWFLFVQFRHLADFSILGLAPAPPPSPPDAPVEIVLASLKRESTSWVHQYLPDWGRSVYVVDDPKANLRVPKNKGREAMVYLTHIIDRYDTLANVTVFAHASRFAWHNDDPDYDAVRTLRRLKLDYVEATGYVNLRCALTLGCPAEIKPHVDAQGPEVSITTTKQVYRQAFRELMPGLEVPVAVGVSCCSQFAVSRDTIHRWSLERWTRWRDWLLKTPLPDDISGRVLEYTWHIIFGKEAIFCPRPADCYCKAFGLCDLKCDEHQCDGRYVLPPYASLPPGWPKVGWKGEARNISGPS